MKFTRLALLFLPLLASAANILLTNDDGWDKPQLKMLYQALTKAGHNCIVSAPKNDKSHLGDKEHNPDDHTMGMRAPIYEHPDKGKGPEFYFGPDYGPSYGHEADDPRYNWVLSTAVTSLRYGIEVIAPKYFENGKIDLVIAGINRGRNYRRSEHHFGFHLRDSSTIAAAGHAARRGIPAIAISGSRWPGWGLEATEGVQIQVDVAMKFLKQFFHGRGKDYLPPGVMLNLNLPKWYTQTHHILCGDTREHQITPANSTGCSMRNQKNCRLGVQVCDDPGLPWERKSFARRHKHDCIATYTILDPLHYNDITDPEITKRVHNQMAGVVQCVPPAL